MSTESTIRTLAEIIGAQEVVIHRLRAERDQERDQNDRIRRAVGCKLGEFPTVEVLADMVVAMRMEAER